MSSPNFLIAINSPALQSFAKNTLEQIGFDSSTVRSAYRPEKAIEMLEESAPDFFLTEYFSTSGYSGIDIVKKAHEKRADLRWAMVSSQKDTALKEHVLSLGAEFFLSKPFTPEDITKALVKAMTDWATKDPDIARIVRAGAVKKEPVALSMQIEPLRQLVPSYPALKVGDFVEYRGKRESVRHVILRKGDVILHLTNTSAMIPADKVRRISAQVTV
jgi:DNA-binding NarL/FixJ family response regulator